MINAILNGLFSFLITIVTALLSPIDSFISANLPDFNNVLSYFGSFIDSVIGFFPWILSWFHIPGALLVFVASYYIFKLSSSAAISIVKLVLAWYRKLMP